MRSAKDGILSCSPLAFLQIVHRSVLLFLLSVSSQPQQEGLPFTTPLLTFFFSFLHLYWHPFTDLEFQFCLLHWKPCKVQVSSTLGHYFIKADRRADRTLLGYSTTLAKWHRIPFDFLPMQIQPAASAGGLVCLVADYRPFAFFVCNPITKVARQLPPRICKRRPRIVCMVVDRLSKAYKIIAAGGYRSDDDCWTTEVFDSVTGCWRVSGSLLQDELTKRTICCRLLSLYLLLSLSLNAGGR